MRAILLPLLALSTLAAGPAGAGSRLTTACQKNLGDGRVLIVDGRFLADGARFRVLSFRPNRVSDGWSYGPCLVDVTR